MANEFKIKNGLYVSGSAQITNNATITGSLIVTNGITGSLQGTASYAITASHALNVPQTASFAISASNANSSISSSYALTASYAMNGGGGGLSALYIQDEGITQGTASYIDFIGDGVTASVTNGTASITISGGGSGTAIQGASVQYSQPTAATTWSINHAINSRTPVVEVYDRNYNVIIPTGIYNPAPFQTQIYFEVSQSGYAIISTGGVLSVSGSNAILNQTSASTTWSFNHELNNLYPVFTIFDSNDDVIIPQRIHAVDTASAVIYFSTPRTGTAVASIAGNQAFATSSLSSSYALSASYAINSSNALNAQTASYVLNAISASYILNARSASYATTASYLEGYISPFPYTGSAVISGSLQVTGTLASNVFMNPQTITSDVIIPAGHNAVIFGPVNMSSSIQVGSGSNLTIIESFTNLATTGSNSFVGNQTITGSLIVTNGITGSLLGTATTASYALTASSADNFTVRGTLTAQTLVIQTITSSQELVTGSLTVLNGITGSLLGTASYALTASYAANVPETSSFAISASQAITSSYAATASYVTGQSPTSSYALTASFAAFALTASTAPGYTVQFTQSVAAATWSFTHNMNTRNPIVQVYDSNYKQIIPNDIVGTGVNTAEIRFDYAATGYAVMSNGGGLYVTGSTSELVQTVGATTWSFTHNLNSKYVAFEVYDSNDYVIIPAGIKVLTTNTAELYFATSQTGRAVAQFSGINGAPNATSASYALTASYANTFTIDRSLIDYAQVNSSTVGSNNLFTQSTGSYTAAFFKYTAASGSNARAGEVSAVWNGATVEFNDVSTADIGSTSAVTGSVSIVGTDVQFNVQTNTSGWRIKSTATFI